MISNFRHGSLVLFCIFFFQFLFLVRPSMSSFGEENPLVEFSSRSDLVEMAGYGEQKLSSVLVTGTVICDVCLGREADIHAWPVSGALVGVSCKSEGNKKTNLVKEITDDYGEFNIDLPSHLHGIPNLDKSCIVRVLRLPKSSPCRPSFIKKPEMIKLSLADNGIRTFTTGRLKLTCKSSKHFQACPKN
ncbi:Pollen Ole e 1 allergen/extensin [Macleaya cordata]|uniref:Pollen Ole e 1 allergen/extensin n=1 Tax=Macleaya cordata TaxID=56857 RepID=A0A200PVF2_MACCD|nr:Pollen Ole e 1 allergen/extensin [Macleaya cordata]